MTAELVPADRLIGQVLAERYQVLHRLGEGAMGVVYKARHVKVGRTFAVKVLHSRLLQDTKVAQRFDREAELAGRLRHANVVGVVDVGEIDGLHYMVMDFAEGPDLAQLLVEAPMPPARIIHLVRQMLEGLYHAHEQGLIHRDFKPENVIVERDSHGAEMPRIVDFGIAILRDGGDSVDGQGRLTTNGLVLGTPHYMAPEQAVADPIDHRIDLFALGIVVYEMLSGRLPFDGSGAEVARANLLLDPPPIAKRVPHLEVDPLLEAFARRMMAKKPKDRPATAKAARELLDLVAHDRSAAAIRLGISAEAGVRAPAETEPLASQQRSPLSPPEPTETRRLRATPSPSAPVAPPYLVPPPRAEGPAPLPGMAPRGPMMMPHGMLPRAPTPLPVGYDVTPPPMPMAYSAPHSGPHLQSMERAPEAALSHQTSVRMPLSWPGNAAQPVAARRRPWLILGVVAGSLGVAIGAILALPGNAKHVDADDRVAATQPIEVQTPPVQTPPVQTPPVQTPPVDPTSGSAATPPPAPTVPGVDASAPGTAGAPAPGSGTVAGAPAGASHPVTSGKTVALKQPVKAVQPVKTVATPGKPAAHRVPGIDLSEAGTAVASPNTPSAKEIAAPAEPVTPAAATPAPAAAKVKPRPSLAGISANNLSVLWREIGQRLMGAAGDRLPAELRDALRKRYTRIHLGTLMGAPQADRDEAADTLQDISDQLH